MSISKLKLVSPLRRKCTGATHLKAFRKLIAQRSILGA